MLKASTWLIRHGQSTSNVGIWSSRSYDVTLTDLGHVQAQKIADQILTSPAHIISSPMRRALQTAEPTQIKWPDVPLDIWPIQEFAYLSRSKYERKTAEQRAQFVRDYWTNLDPFYCDGADSESFAGFIDRLKVFHQDLMNEKGHVLVFGHGQFFKAFLLGTRQGFLATPEWMRSFHQEESTHPLQNGEIIPWDGRVTV